MLPISAKTSLSKVEGLKEPDEIKSSRDPKDTRDGTCRLMKSEHKNFEASPSGVSAVFMAVRNRSIRAFTRPVFCRIPREEIEHVKLTIASAENPDCI
jgi:hypothetical protein